MLSAALRSLIATGPSRPNVQLTLSLTRHCDMPPTRCAPRTAEDCGRSAAQARCKGSNAVTALMCIFRQLRKARQDIAAFPRRLGSFSRVEMLTRPKAEDYISPSWTRRRLARWRVCEAPHCLHGDIIRPCSSWPCSDAAADVRRFSGLAGGVVLRDGAARFRVV